MKNTNCKFFLTISLLLLVISTCGAAEYAILDGNSSETANTPTGDPVPALMAPYLELTTISGHEDSSIKNDTLVIDNQSDDPIQLVNRWGKGVIRQIKLSPDGKELAVATSLGIYLYNTSDYQQIYMLEDKSMANCLDFSPDGSRIAFGLEDGTARIIQTIGGKDENILKGHTKNVVSIDFAPDGNSLATGSGDGTIKLWSTNDGSEIKTIKAHQDIVGAIAFSPDGQFLVSGSDDKNVKLWKTSDGSLVKRLGSHNFWVSSVAFTPDGKSVLSSSWDGTIKEWAVEPVKFSGALSSLTSVLSLVFSPDGSFFAFNSDKSTVRLIDLTKVTYSEKDKKFVFSEGTLNIPGKSVKSMEFSPDNLTIYTASPESVKVWNVEFGSLIHSLDGFSDIGRDMAVSPDGRFIATVDVISNKVVLSNGEDGSFLYSLENNDGITRLIFSPDSKVLACGAVDGSITLWQTVNGQSMATIHGEGHEITSLAYSPDGQVLASGVFGGKIKLWNSLDQSPIKTLSRQTNYIESLSFSPDGQRLASSSSDHSIIVWGLPDGKVLKTLTGHKRGVNGVAFSPDGQLLASVSEDKSINFWDLQNGKPIKSLGLEEKGFSLAFSPDGKILATGMGNGLINLWDTETGELIAAGYEGHWGDIINLTFSPDGQNLILYSTNGTISVWAIHK